MAGGASSASGAGKRYLAATTRRPDVQKEALDGGEAACKVDLFWYLLEFLYPGDGDPGGTSGVASPSKSTTSEATSAASLEEGRRVQ